MNEINSISIYLQLEMNNEKKNNTRQNKMRNQLGIEDDILIVICKISLKKCPINFLPFFCCERHRSFNERWIRLFEFHNF